MTTPESQNHPNILFLMSDQHHHRLMGCAGHPQVQTPHLDRLASEGVRCTNAITVSPICTPSRVSFLSGQYPHNHGYHGNSGPNPNGLPNLLGHCRSHGYKTAAIGKIHCPEYWIEDSCDVFHEVLIGCSVGGRSGAYHSFLKERGKQFLEDNDKKHVFPNITVPRMDSWLSALTYEESPEGWIADQTIEFMRTSHEAGKPFCIHASMPRPHQMTAPSEPFWSMYDKEDIWLPPNADYDMQAAKKAPNLINTADWWRNTDWAVQEPRDFESTRRRKQRGYFGAISQVDHAVGQIMQAVKEMGLSENTIVVYVADHGDYACEHGIMEKAPGICSDAITRIPMIWWAPGNQDYSLPSGKVVDELIQSTDTIDTLCSLANLPRLETSDGRDATKLIREEQKLHDFAMTEFAWSKSIRKGKYRLVYYPKEYFPNEYPEGFGELYDLEADPWEMQNLYFEAEHKELIRDLQSELLNWLVTTTRPVSTLGARALVQEQATKRNGMLNYADGKLDPKSVRETTIPNYL